MTPGEWCATAGQATNLWLLDSLAAFDQQLRSSFGQGAGIVVRQGDAASELAHIAKKLECRYMLYNKRYSAIGAKMDVWVER